LETAKKSTKILQSSERGFGEESLFYSLFQCLLFMRKVNLSICLY
jgi:hypothetical protein